MRRAPPTPRREVLELVACCLSHFNERLRSYGLAFAVCIFRGNGCNTTVYPALPERVVVSACVVCRVSLENARHGLQKREASEVNVTLEPALGKICCVSVAGDDGEIEIYGIDPDVD